MFAASCILRCMSEKTAPAGEPCPVCVSTCPPLVCMPCGWMPCCLSSSPAKHRCQLSVHCSIYLFVCVHLCARAHMHSSLHWMCICSISLTSVMASRSSSANFLSSSPLGEQKLTSCFFSEVKGLSMVMPCA